MFSVKVTDFSYVSPFAKVEVIGVDWINCYSFLRSYDKARGNLGSYLIVLGFVHVVCNANVDAKGAVLVGNQDFREIVSLLLAIKQINRVVGFRLEV